jgi:hypothetical protein
LRLADLVERHFDELSSLDTLDMGAPIIRTRGTRQRVLGMLRWYAGHATSIHGETIQNSPPGEMPLTGNHAVSTGVFGLVQRQVDTAHECVGLFTRRELGHAEARRNAINKRLDP